MAHILLRSYSTLGYIATRQVDCLVRDNNMDNFHTQGVVETLLLSMSHTEGVCQHNLTASAAPVFFQAIIAAAARHHISY